MMKFHIETMVVTTSSKYQTIKTPITIAILWLFDPSGRIRPEIMLENWT